MRPNSVCLQLYYVGQVYRGDTCVERSEGYKLCSVRVVSASCDRSDDTAFSSLPLGAEYPPLM
jgi:hypothetical protein